MQRGIPVQLGWGAKPARAESLRPGRATANGGAWGGFACSNVDLSPSGQPMARVPIAALAVTGVGAIGAGGSGVESIARAA